MPLAMASLNPCEVRPEVLHVERGVRQVVVDLDVEVLDAVGPELVDEHLGVDRVVGVGADLVQCVLDGLRVAVVERLVEVLQVGLDVLQGLGVQERDLLLELLGLTVTGQLQRGGDAAVVETGIAGGPPVGQLVGADRDRPGVGQGAGERPGAHAEVLDHVAEVDLQVVLGGPARTGGLGHLRGPDVVEVVADPAVDRAVLLQVLERPSDAGCRPRTRHSRSRSGPGSTSCSARGAAPAPRRSRGPGSGAPRSPAGACRRSRSCACRAR